MKLQCYTGVRDNCVDRVLVSIRSVPFYLQVLVAGLVGVQASKSDVRYGTVPAPRDRCLVRINYLNQYVT